MVVSDGMEAMLHPNSDCRLIMTAMICVQSENPLAISGVARSTIATEVTEDWIAIGLR